MHHKVNAYQSYLYFIEIDHIWFFFFVMLGHLINHPKTLEKSSSFFVIHETAMAPEPAFSPDQLTWIIYKYGELKCVIKVMRAFRIKFCPNNRKDMPSRMSFYRAVKRFESSDVAAEQY